LVINTASDLGGTLLPFVPVSGRGLALTASEKSAFRQRNSDVWKDNTTIPQVKGLNLLEAQGPAVGRAEKCVRNRAARALKAGRMRLRFTKEQVMSRQLSTFFRPI
jgi:hypothetical protein